MDIIAIIGLIAVIIALGFSCYSLGRVNGFIQGLDYSEQMLDEAIKEVEELKNGHHRIT